MKRVLFLDFDLVFFDLELEVLLKGVIFRCFFFLVFKREGDKFVFKFKLFFILDVVLNIGDDIRVGNFF